MITAVRWIPRQCVALARSSSEEESLGASARGQPQGALSPPPVNPRERDDDDDDDDDDEGWVTDEDVMADNAAATAAAAAATAAAAAAAASREDKAVVAEFNLDKYDEEEDEEEGGFGGGGGGIFGGVESMYYKTNRDDPYMRSDNGVERMADDDSDAEGDDEENADMTIREDDLLIVCTRADSDAAALEICVYEPAAPNLFAHHDIPLSAMPLCLDWMSCGPSMSSLGASNDSLNGNFAAVGFFEPEIQIWDLNIVDTLEPIGHMGGVDANKTAENLAAAKEKYAAARQKASKAQRKREKRKMATSALTFRPGSHRDSIMCLAWNPLVRNVLASGSADKSVKLWDVVTLSCESTADSAHSDKVQTACWHPLSAHSLVSAGFDRCAVLHDGRKFGSNGELRFRLDGDAEAAAFNPTAPDQLIVSTDRGTISVFDVRMSGSGSTSEEEALFSWSAHKQATCDFSFSAAYPGLFATCSADNTVALWDVRAMSGNGKAASTAPINIASKNMGIGALFTATFCTDSPTLLCIGGSSGPITIWDMAYEEAVGDAFGKPLQTT